MVRRRGGRFKGREILMTRGAGSGCAHACEGAAFPPMSYASLPSLPGLLSPSLLDAPQKKTSLFG